MVRKIFFASSVLVPLAIAGLASIWPQAWWAFVGVGPLLVLGWHDVLQTRHSILRIYPILGHGRYLLEELRPEIQQYFVESNIDGMPFSREFRSLIYQRAKGARDTVAFGTQQDVNRVGYEWMNHSLAPRPIAEEEKKVIVGGETCQQPYHASHLNISAMSFGSLSRNAILALNWGAKMGGFYHNTGEGGVSPYHLKHGGDLVWQIGTGYFGCRDEHGNFCPDRFRDQASIENIKMIEIKISQGAKPGHGGILPASKLTPEIAQIRGVSLGRDVISPPAHTAFSDPTGLVEFVAQLRELSGGKPVGFKLCVGHRSQFLGVCKAMVETGLHPDFITVDGAEGGTGAAPLELSNSVGMPMRDGLLFVNSALRGFGLRKKIRLIAAGKVATAFHMFRCLALGADICNSARAMMFALGCIQARRCNSNDCPVGVATQDPGRTQGLVVTHKAKRVAHYHWDTIRSFLELVASSGHDDPEEIGPHAVLRRIDPYTVRNFDKIYEYLPEGALLSEDTVPEGWRNQWLCSRADRFY